MMKKLTSWINLERAPVAASAAALAGLCLLGAQVRLSAARAEAPEARDLDNRIGQWMERQAWHDAGHGRACADVLAAMNVPTRAAAECASDVFDEPARTGMIGICGMGGDTESQCDPAREAAAEFAGLKLQMALLNEDSMAVINGQMVHEGSQLKHLTVTEIRADRVILSYQDRKFELKANSVP